MTRWQLPHRSQPQHLHDDRTNPLLYSSEESVLRLRCCLAWPPPAISRNDSLVHNGANSSHTPFLCGGRGIETADIESSKPRISTIICFSWCKPLRISTTDIECRKRIY